MTHQGFVDYLFAIFNTSGSRAASSYIQAIRIIDEMFVHDDVFALNGKSVTCIDDSVLLKQIADFVCAQQVLYIKGEDSIFRNVSSSQSSYPGKRFCSAAIKQLLNYQLYNAKEEEAWHIVKEKNHGRKLSNVLISHFNIDKEGKDKTVSTKVRLGQDYFRKMILSNYDYKCCVTGLNIPQTLIASHIVGWADDKANRMNPENGLCLSATYDAAFDKHLISFDDNYRMIVSKEIKEYYTSEVTKEYFDNFDGKQITLPERFCPSKKLLAKHREQMVG